MKSFRFIVSNLTLLALILTPFTRIEAAPSSVLGPSIQAGIDAIISGQAALPSVPTSDKLQDVKEVKQCYSIFGKPVCFPGLDKIAITIAKAYIERMVDSTVEWINNGFDGNPAYVTDPKQYFLDIADGLGGEFIMGTGVGSTTLDFLCSPFRANIKLSLQQNFQKAPDFQCRISGIKGNIEDFYHDFTNGGLESWFSITQNWSNQPYGAYVNAQIELDKRVAEAIGVQNKELSWSGGFLSFKQCISKDNNGKCIAYGPTKTPGTVIENQLEGVLGSGLKQLELADEFDELIGALLGQLLKETIFNEKGLFGNKYKVSETQPINPTTNPNAPGGGEGGNTGEPTEWGWIDRGGPAIQSTKCPDLNAQSYFQGLIGSAPVSAWKETMSSIEPSLWNCGIGQQKSSGGEVRGRLFLPTVQCPDATPLAGEEILGVRQDPLCWAHEVDVLGFSASETVPTEPNQLP